MKIYRPTCGARVSCLWLRGHGRSFSWLTGRYFSRRKCRLFLVLKILSNFWVIWICCLMRAIGSGLASNLTVLMEVRWQNRLAVILGYSSNCLAASISMFESPRHTMLVAICVTRPYAVGVLLADFHEGLSFPSLGFTRKFLLEVASRR